VYDINSQVFFLADIRFDYWIWIHTFSLGRRGFLGGVLDYSHLTFEQISYLLFQSIVMPSSTETSHPRRLKYSETSL